MTYFLLASLPGSLLIPYGDEYGMENISDLSLSPEEIHDARNINRGMLSSKVTNSEKGKRIVTQITRIIERRQVLKNYLNVWPQEITTDDEVFGARYTLGTSELVIFVNISGHQKNIPFDPFSFQEISNVNATEIEKNQIKLGPNAGVWLQK